MRASSHFQSSLGAIKDTIDEVIHIVSFTMSDKGLFFPLGVARLIGSLYKVIRETDLIRNHCSGYCFLSIDIPISAFFENHLVYRYKIYIGTSVSKIKQSTHVILG